VSASEKLKALAYEFDTPRDGATQQVRILDALPQIVALIEAAEEPANEIISDSLVPVGDDWRPRFPKLVEAFEALDKALP